MEKAGWMGVMGSVSWPVWVMLALVFYYLVGLLHVVALARWGWTFHEERKPKPDGLGWTEAVNGDAPTVECVMALWPVIDVALLASILPRWLASRVPGKVDPVASEPLKQRDPLPPRSP